MFHAKAGSSQSGCEDALRREQPAWRGLALQSLGATCPQALSLLILIVELLWSCHGSFLGPGGRTHDHCRRAAGNCDSQLHWGARSFLIKAQLPVVMRPPQNRGRPGASGSPGAWAGHQV